MSVSTQAGTQGPGRRDVLSRALLWAVIED
jgi:hypothetical protein